MQGDAGKVEDMRIAGAILAGGQSSRMGANKAVMDFAGEPLLQRVFRRLVAGLGATNGEMIVIGPKTLKPVVPQAHIIGDIVPAAGPLGGLYTALKTTTADRIFLMACDMPLLQPGLVRAMCEYANANPASDVIVLPQGDHPQPLHTIYARSCLPVVERALASQDHSMHALLAQLTVVAIPPDVAHREDPHGFSSFNVNTPTHWREALRLAADFDAS